MYDTPPAFAHATMDTAAFDATQEYCFCGDMCGTPPVFAHATMDTAAFDAIQEYCTRDIVCSSVLALAFRVARLPVLRLKASFIPAANSSLLRK